MNHNSRSPCLVFSAIIENQAELKARAPVQDKFTRYIANGNLTHHYVHDLAGNIIAEYDGAGTVIREYIWLDERPMAVVDHAGSTPVLYHVRIDHFPPRAEWYISE